jgi:hypothetical protein
LADQFARVKAEAALWIEAVMHDDIERNDGAESKKIVQILPDTLG